MKRVGLIATLIFLIPILVIGYTSPGKPQGFVNDFAKIISDTTQSSLEQQLSEFEKNASMEVVVVTIPELKDETIETYAVKIFEEWGIGDKEKDTGVLFLIAPNDRVVRIEVGYGLEGVLTDLQSNGIIQKVVLPEFRNGNLEGGIIKGVDAIISVINVEADYSKDSVPSRSSSGVFKFMQNYGIIIFFILISVLGSTKSWWLGGVLGAVAGIVIGIFSGIGVGIFATVILIIFGLILDYLVSKGGGRGGGFWGGFGGGHGGSGGFGGFGGGMSGGGGASGKW